MTPDQTEHLLNTRAKSPREELLEKALGLHSPWPLKDILSKLAEGCEILLHEKSYDGHGHELISEAVRLAKTLNQTPSPEKE